MVAYRVKYRRQYCYHDCWLNESQVVVLTETDDSQTAIDYVRLEVLARYDDKAAPDAPVNTVKGFQLVGVERIATVNVII